jgi:AmmeMemoRadiSam system protein B
MIRQPEAREFYAGDCARMAEQFLRGVATPAEPARIVAGVVPHAGWMYSGMVAARVFGAIHRKQTVDTFVIFGAIHRWAGRNAVYASGEWATPLGALAVDEKLARELLVACGGVVADDAQAHAGEHAIEVQLPFIKHWFPHVRIVPVSVGPDSAAVEIGTRVGGLLRQTQRAAVVIGSTDLTHYGEPYNFMPLGVGERAETWMHANDRRVIDLAVKMDAAHIVREARAHQNACGSGALAATVAAAAALGADRGHLLEYRTSFNSAPDAVFRMAVGYAGIVF